MKTILLLFLPLCSFGQVKISQMQPATNLDEAWIPIIQNGKNKRASAKLFIRTDTVIKVIYVFSIKDTVRNKVVTIKPKSRKVNVLDISGGIVKDGNQGRNIKY